MASSATTVLIPDMEEAIINGDLPFTDAMGRSYDEVKAIMDAQHPYLVRFSEATANWSKAKSYPEYFAGAYFRNETDFVVKTTSTNDSVVKEVKAIFGKDSYVELAKYSYADLFERQEQIVKEIQDRNIEARACINMEKNTVAVEIANDTRGKNVASEDFLAKFSTEPFSISYTGSFVVEPTASIGNNTGCYYTATGHTSSLGCWISQSGVNKILCAGHSPNGVTGTSSSVYTSNSQSTKIGYISFARYNSGVTTAGDFALITADSSATPAAGNQPVSGFYTSSIIPNNTYVYRNGKNTSASGYVLATGSIICYSGDTGYRTDMVQANYATTIGESGNAVVAGNNLLIGIQGGGTGPSYFTPWWLIASAI